MNEQTVLIVGDDIDSAIVIGPFSSAENAIRYAEIDCRNEEWAIASLYPPRQMEDDK